MAKINYRYAGVYDLMLFTKFFFETFSKNPRFNPGALPNLSTLVALINQDPEITDVRWAAYMLATVMWETTSPVTIKRPAKNRKGQTLMKNGAPILVTERKWLMTMAPVEEVGHGKGRRYHEPVKIATLVDGGVRVTEQDGDQFLVSSSATVRPVNRDAVMGSRDGGAVSKKYDDDAGIEEVYYGRGYVQLTWWSNYAAASVALGKGLELLRRPELVLDPSIAYALMSHGMRTGDGFANGRKFIKYFSGFRRDYTGARAMVNGSDHAEDIAAIAEAFEVVLLNSRMSPRTTSPSGDALQPASSRWA